MPFTCDACGRRDAFPDLIPAIGDVLRCPHCADERRFVRPPLLVVAGAPGTGKSTICARLAGTIPGAVLLDADIFAEDMVSVVPPNADYPAFWRSMMRLAHELAQNNLSVVYLSTMLPEQVLANTDALAYFDAVHFLCLTCPPDVIRARLVAREATNAAAAVVVRRRSRRWIDFDAALVTAAAGVATATVLDAGRSLDDVARDVRAWITDRLPPASGG